MNADTALKIYLSSMARKYFGDEWFTEDEFIRMLRVEPDLPAITTNNVVNTLDELVGSNVLTRTIGRNFKFIPKPETPVATGNVPSVADKHVSPDYVHITMILRPNSHSTPKIKRQFGRKLVFLHEAFVKSQCLDCNEARSREYLYCSACNELNNFLTAIAEVYRESFDELEES